MSDRPTYVSEEDLENQALVMRFISEQWEFENDAVKAEVWEDVKLQVLICAADGSWPAYDAVTGYESDHGHQFQDFFDGYGCDEYTFHYIWILYAIIASIRKYDAAKLLKVLPQPKPAISGGGSGD